VFVASDYSQSAIADSDGDGLANGNDPSPNNPESSNDGVSDYFKNQHNLSGVQSTSSLTGVTVPSCPQ
jgi:hypothetical protein